MLENLKELHELILKLEGKIEEYREDFNYPVSAHNALYWLSNIKDMVNKEIEWKENE